MPLGNIGNVILLLSRLPWERLNKGPDPFKALEHLRSRLTEKPAPPTLALSETGNPSRSPLTPHISPQQLGKLLEDVPDVNDPFEINYWVTRGDERIYLEGWADVCLTGTGFPLMEEGGQAGKIAYMEDLTPEILKGKAKEWGMELVKGGFVETEEADNLYGITYGVYRKANPAKSPALPVRQPFRVAKPTTEETGNPKELWEMTRREWLTDRERASIAEGFGWSKEGEAHAAQLHKRTVENALAANVYVPTKVLKDYPDLAAKFPKPPVEAPGAGAKRVTFQRGDLKSAIEAARRLKADHDLYIMPTAEGLTIEHTAPPTWMRHVIVHPDGTYKNVMPYMPAPNPQEAVSELSPHLVLEEPLSQALDMPTTQETIDELKRRLAKEIYRMELDLMGGGRIAGKPCDCLGKKHHLGLEATAEELIPMEANPIYFTILSWVKEHEAEFQPRQVAKTAPEHYMALAPEMRRFRKQVMGTEFIGAMLSSDEKESVLARAKAMIEPEGGGE